MTNFSPINSLGIRGITRTRAFLQSVAVTVVYWILAAFYIWWSSSWAASTSLDKAALERVEQIKGTAFVIATGLFFLIAAYYFIRNIERRNRLLLYKDQKIAEAERTVMVGLMSAALSHDISNLAMVTSGNLELLEAKFSLDEDVLSFVRRSRKSAEETAALIDRLKAVEKGDYLLKREKVHLRSRLDDLIDIARQHHRLKKAEIALTGEASPVAMLHSLVFNRMILNLLINAADAGLHTDEIPRIEIRLDVRGQTVVLEIHDSGHGLSPEKAREMSKPLYTTKKGGSGLGLVSLDLFTRSSGGQVEVVQSELGGACFSIQFPLDYKPPVEEGVNLANQATPA